MAPTKPLTAVLTTIDKHLAKVAPDGARSLRPPASDEALGRLAAIFPDRIVPDDLRTWFAWHDGQEGEASPGLDPDAEALVLMSIDAALAERARLIEETDKMLPWSDDWLPIAENFGGDCYVYVTAGASAGAIVFYLHDDSRRPVIGKTLAAYAGALGRRLASRAKPVVKRGFGPVVEPLADVPEPTIEDLEAAPIGTFYYKVARVELNGPPHHAYWYSLIVKLEARSWLRLTGELAEGSHADEHAVEAALADLGVRLAEPKLTGKLTPNEVLNGLRSRSADSAAYHCRKRGRLAIKPA